MNIFEELSKSFGEFEKSVDNLLNEKTDENSKNVKETFEKFKAESTEFKETYTQKETKNRFLKKE
jgi:hypothetical protein